MLLLIRSAHNILAGGSIHYHAAMGSNSHVQNHRATLAEVGMRMYEKGLVAATDGNLSVRDAEGLWITAANCPLQEIEHFPCSLVQLDLGGRTRSEKGTPSSEWRLHVEVYHRRPDVKAVIHAHPPIASAFMFAGKSALLAQAVIPEVVVGFGTIPLAPYATPSSEEGPAAISGLIEKHDVILLDRHGSLTVGHDLWDAYRKLEKLEHAAHIIFMSTQLGGLIPLSQDELRRLHLVAGRSNRSA